MTTLSSFIDGHYFAAVRGSVEIVYQRATCRKFHTSRWIIECSLPYDSDMPDEVTLFTTSALLTAGSLYSNS